MDFRLLNRTYLGSWFVKTGTTGEENQVGGPLRSGGAFSIELHSIHGETS